MWYNVITSAKSFFVVSETCATRRTPAFGEGGTRQFHFRETANKFFMGGADIMANEVRVKVTLVCTECKQRNYDTMKNKKNNPDRLELKKHCKFCRKHTLHKESK